MVMSDSDDTDILLLIPPNFFLANAEEQLLLEDLKVLHRRQFQSLQEINCLDINCRQNFLRRRLTRDLQAMDLAGCKNYDSSVMPPPPPAVISSSYQCLPPTRKAEINDINAKLHYLEREEMIYGDSPSDISSISANTIRTQLGPSRANREPVGMIHSTPKNMSSSFKEQCQQQFSKNRKNSNMPSSKEGDVLLEIDHFLLNDGLQHNVEYWQQTNINGYCNNQYLQQQDFQNVLKNHQTQTSALPTELQIPPSEKSLGSGNGSGNYQTSKGDNNLISLSEIWGKSGQATAIAASSQSNLKEEQLRRQHLEKTVRHLQARLLEYQQRLSVAIEVDRSKDNALNTA
ncbi:hypothetical protein DOY81_003429, partial [Sarcophaga bullata]